ncbi:fish-egg lectin-like [Hyla sarda]|uniref:fish-egg lectin-like n=1 Tax=Hyla sarda TaxID=327740 RepID=UPI0024C3E227|nr:fish-egg lectin-like [Hyla sarda]XP_056399729.1 fish-egg lectin-like [Hyla sarda]XP_056399730.1 fish-egg lectin-like [Hyla sarda]XP_056399731.1 fish-egg lectin-like [Hyla sarda]XP_056399732.1 fish-egg lectin-like [Hyla sarda]XP_056399733.1 fish-egg lectin-like [Hyla sarda]
MIFILGLFLLSVSAVTADLQCLLMPGKLRQIDAGAGQVYGVNDKGNIFKMVNNNWQQVSGLLTHVSVGPAGVWGVYKENRVFKLQDNKWKLVTGYLKQVDAGGDKFLAGVNAQDNIFCLMQNCTVSRSSLVTFLPLDGSLKYYSCGPFGCWGVNNVDDIFYRQDVSPNTCQGSKWQQVDGKLIMVEVGTDGSVYGVNSVGEAFKREGISAKTPTGTAWKRLDFCATFSHVTYDAGFLWLLSENDDVYKCYEEA